MDSSNHRIGLQFWAPEGIAGRGILLDYALYASLQSPPISYSTFSTHSIPFSTILDMCKYFNVSPKRGDILLIRTGVIPEWDSWDDEKKEAYGKMEHPEHAGVEACEELLEWLWDGGIAAVCGDAISWEVGLCLQAKQSSMLIEAANRYIRRQARCQCMNICLQAGACLLVSTLCPLDHFSRSSILLYS